MIKKISLILCLTAIIITTILAVNFYTIKYFDNKLQESPETFKTIINKSDSTILLRSEFIDDERFFLKIAMIGGDTILGFCDTGGGVSMLMPNALNNSNKSMTKAGLIRGIMPVNYILLKDILADKTFPLNTPSCNRIIRNPFRIVNNSYLLIPPNNEELKKAQNSLPQMKAFLGQDFFMNKSWTFDYVNKKVYVNTPIKKSELNRLNTQKIGLKKNKHGINRFGHARFKIEVEGETIDVLFDTGATSILSEDGKHLLKCDKTSIGISFIAESIFNKWRNKHPGWKYYPNADLSEDIIEVPCIKICDYVIGPVLFSKRPDENWSEGMNSTMDSIVKGAIGGNVLKPFKVTIDYNSELILFDK